MQDIFKDRLDCSLSTIYLGYVAAHLLVQDEYLLKILLLAVNKKAVAQKWLHTEPQTNTDLMDTVSKYGENDFSLNLRFDQFWKYWEKWIVYVSTQDIS